MYTCQQTRFSIKSVQAWVPLLDCSVDTVQDVAARITVDVFLHWEFAWRRGKLQVFLEVASIAASVVGLSKSVHEGLVQGEQITPVVNVGNDRDSLLESLITNDWIVDGSAGKIEVLLVILLEEAIGDVWNVVPSI